MCVCEEPKAIWVKRLIQYGGPEGARTPDLRVANAGALPPELQAHCDNFILSYRDY